MGRPRSSGQDGGRGRIYTVGASRAWRLHQSACRGLDSGNNPRASRQAWIQGTVPMHPPPKGWTQGRPPASPPTPNWDRAGSHTSIPPQTSKLAEPAPALQDGGRSAGAAVVAAGSKTDLGEIKVEEAEAGEEEAAGQAGQEPVGEGLLEAEGLQGILQGGGEERGPEGC